MLVCFTIRTGKEWLLLSLEPQSLREDMAEGVPRLPTGRLDGLDPGNRRQSVSAEAL